MANLREELVERFAHHPPVNPYVARTHDEVRKLMTETANEIANMIPPSREASLAQTALQEAAMWANAAVAIHLNKSELDSTTP